MEGESLSNINTSNIIINKTQSSPPLPLPLLIFINYKFNLLKRLCKRFQEILKGSIYPQMFFKWYQVNH